ncbi:hypothetical protein [Aeromicrobium sp.]|uniref:hypothetical protein n=1 Tax=Aeromicrobium sp. TaxID=1871063 RepID=UPI002FC8DDCE
MWSHILRDQLEVTSDEFWACVRDGKLPDRGAPEVPQEALPASIVFQLIREVGLSEAEVGAMSKDEALERMQRFWATGN